MNHEMTKRSETGACARDGAGLSRRTLLGGAAAGFVLTASGLYVPDEAEEAEAREGALGGKLGGRRGKDRRGIDKAKRRDRGDNKDPDRRRRDNAPPRDHGPFRATALTVLNRFGIINGVGRPVDCIFYYRIKTGLDAYGPLVVDIQRTLAPGESFRYDPDRYRVSVLIKKGFDTFNAQNDVYDVYADMRNVSFWYPRGSVTAGLDLDPPSGKMGSSTLVREQDYTQDEFHHDDRGRVGLTRSNDSDNRIEWQLDVG